MRLHDLFPGSFSAEHFEDGPVVLTIAGITPIIFEEDGEQRQKGKMTFAETSQYWVFGKEAAGELAEQLGDETDEWVGHAIELRQDRTSFKGKRVACVRGCFMGPNGQPIDGKSPALPEKALQDVDLADLEALLAQKKAEAAS